MGIFSLYWRKGRLSVFCVIGRYILGGVVPRTVRERRGLEVEEGVEVEKGAGG